MINICNFCLKVSSCCSSVDETLKQRIELIFINIEFVISECSLICEECSQNIQLAFDLKAPSISNEDFLASCEANIPRPDIYLEKNKIKCELFPNTLRICRFCLTGLGNNSFSLENLGVDTNIREIFTTQFPEIDFTATNNPILCNNCLKKLQNYVLFISSWLDIYNLKRKYCLYSNKSDIPDLNKVREYMLETNTGRQHLDSHGINSASIKNTTLKLKEFENNREPIVENSTEEQNVTNRDYVLDNIQVKDDIEDHELKYPVEKMQIKTESVSGDVQLGHNGFKLVEESKQRKETFLFEPKLESDDFVLKDEEISLNDEINSDDQGMNQEKFNECYSFLKDEVPSQTSKNSTFNSSFLSPRIEEKCRTLNKSVEQLRSSRNSAYQVIKINNNPLEAKEKMHFENYHSSNYSRLILDTNNSDNFEKLIKTELSEISYCDYKKHLKTDYVTFLYKCEQCDYTTENKNNIKLHVKKHSDTVFVCEHCEYKTTLKSRFKSHSKVHSNNCNLYKCEFCDFKTKYNNCLTRHQIVHSNELYKCEHCAYKTKKQIYLKRHEKRHSDEFEFYKCEHCDYKTKYKPDLKKHVLVHFDECNFYRCELCYYKTKYKNALKTHLKVHSDDNNLYKRVFKKYLKQHSDGSHIYKCDHCDYNTKSKSTLKWHIKRHSDQFIVYKCEQCDYKSKYKNCIEAHLIVHSNNCNIYKCEHCGFNTKYENYFKCHVNRHSDEFPHYKCVHCDFKSKYKNSLKMHLTRDSDGCKLYRCEHCNYKTKFSNFLECHMKRHSDKPHKIIF